MQHPFNQTGYTPPKIQDSRNFIYEKAVVPQPFPTTYKTDTSVIPRLYQGDRAACVEHAVAKAIMYKEFKQTGKVTLLSPRFLAALTVKMDGFPLSQGTSLLNALKIAQKDGICEEQYFPNDVTLSDADYCDLTKISPEAYTNALTHKIDSYAFLSDLSANGLHNAIYQNGILIVGMKICSSWWTSLKGVVSWLAADILPLRPPVKNDPTTSGHAFLLNGYDETFDYLDNEWGNDWASQGFAWYGANDRPYIYEAVTLVTLTPEQKIQAQSVTIAIDGLVQAENMPGTTNIGRMAINMVIKALGWFFADIFAAK